MNVNEIRTTPPQITPLKSAPKKSATTFESELAKTSAPETRTSPTEELTNSERTYFSELFPKSAEDIRNYNPYRREGAATDTRIGSLFDKRG